MSILEAALLGAIQGLTEFLPVSSSGHLVLAQAVMGWKSTGLLLEVAVHFATLLAVVVVLRSEVAGLFRGALDCLRGRRTEEARLVILVALGTVPAVVVGLGLEHRIEEAFASPKAAALGLLATAAILGSTLLARRRDADLGVAAALAIGCAQALAILPGISRSGSTIAVALLIGIAAPRAFTFSFLLSIPAILGATILKIGDAVEGGVSADLMRVAGVAGVVAFATGIGALLVLRRMVERGRFAVFAPYCLVLGLVALIWIP